MSLDTEIAIIGTGFSGISMAVHLQKLKMNQFTIFEKSDRVGGTWRENTYPGSACDIPSYLYSFSFAPNRNWSKRNAEQPEILEYIEKVFKKYHLDQQTLFQKEIVKAEFDDSQGRWFLTDQEGMQYRCKVLITCCGQLSRPMLPPIQGLKTFQGEVFHSANWNHDYDLKGKSIGIIGNGASAIQIVPRIVKDVKRLTIFQRSAHWILPKLDPSFSQPQKFMLAHLPGFHHFYRWYLYVTHEARFFGLYRGSILAKWYQHRVQQQLKKQITCSESRKLLIPDYPIGCKRTLISSEYYSAIQNSNVYLVNSPISKIGQDAIYTLQSSYTVDGIILATGFKSTEFLSPMTITGLHQQNLNKVWEKGAEAYLGMTVTGFPNFFMLYGPNTNLGHNSILLMIESQSRYISQCVKMIFSKNLKYLNTSPAASLNYNQMIQRKMQKTAWTSGCHSWYMNTDGKIVNNWPYFTWSYLFKTRRPHWNDFEFC